MIDNEPEEVELTAMVIAIRELAEDSRFQRFLGHIQARMDAYVVDMGDPRVYNVHGELSNTAGRVDELRQLLNFINECRVGSAS
jgi:hypothetical protein